MDSDPLHQPHPDTVVAELATAKAHLSASQSEVAQLREALNAAATREQLLADELQHRVRNMLAVIRSIFRRTLENGASQDEFAEHFQGRLNAIARYQTGVVELHSCGIELEDIIRDELLDVNCLDGPNCKIAGPSVRLQNKSAELIGLAVHELVTNAVKFGALYHQGMLSVEWTLTGSAAEATLHLRWKETGVSLLSAAPRPRGFGQDLIEEALPYQLGATTSFEFKPGGLDCSIELPLSTAIDPSQAALGTVGDVIPLFSSDAE